MGGIKKEKTFNSTRVAQGSILIALIFALSFIERALPLSALVGGAVPGIKLGLANTVLLYALYLLPAGSCVLLMLVKVVISGILYGSAATMLYSFCGSALSLAVMFFVKKNPARGTFVLFLLAVAAGVFLLIRHPSPKGEILIYIILVFSGGFLSLLLFLVLQHRSSPGVCGVSMLGAAAHNIGQTLAAALLLGTPALLYTYLPVLLGVGSVMGALTGVIAQRVLTALSPKTARPQE